MKINYFDDVELIKAQSESIRESKENRNKIRAFKVRCELTGTLNASLSIFIAKASDNINWLKCYGNWSKTALTK